jgi:hypothetical protein
MDIPIDNKEEIHKKLLDDKQPANDVQIFSMFE